MKIDNNLMVSLAYELRESNLSGRIIETVGDENPLSFIYGTGRLLPSFEANLGSLSKGDSFSFSLGAADAYGERREEMIVDVPLSIFQTDGKLNEDICKVGNEVPMVDSSGNRLLGIICEISDNLVKMDFNHPMAGVNLCFSGRVLDVRVPSESELEASYSSCSGCNPETNTSCSCGN